MTIDEKNRCSFVSPVLSQSKGRGDLVSPAARGRGDYFFAAGKMSFNEAGSDDGLAVSNL